MVPELTDVMKKMQKQLKGLELNDDMQKRKLEELETQVKEFSDMKDTVWR